jgi:activator of 2-hydroxyglutaryl-CoA dehydratase
MNFEEFQNQSRLYVIGALEPEELEEFERERKKSGKRAEDFITQCYVLHETFALSLRPEKAFASIKEQLTSMVRERKQVRHARNAANDSRIGDDSGSTHIKATRPLVHVAVKL